MRIIQTYCTFEGDKDRSKAGFPTIRAFMHFFKKAYGTHSKYKYMLYTDEWGREILKDIVKQEHLRVITFPFINDNIPYIGKFHVQKLQNEPYIHVDLDAVLYEPPYSCTADVVTERMREVGFGREIEALEMEADVYRTEIQKDGSIAKFPKFNRIVCSGLLGFNNMSLQKKYIESIENKLKLIERKRIISRFEVCYTIEETLLTAIIRENNCTVKELCPCAYIHVQGSNKL